MTEIFKIRLSLSNCYLIKGSKNILVDTGSPNEAKKIISAIEKLGVQLKDISLILHTHGHSDHCGSTAELINTYRIPIAIHSADKQLIEKGNNGFLKPTSLMGKILKPFVDKPFAPFIVDIEADTNLDLNKFGINATIHHTAGHTAGSITIEFDNKEAIIGDLLMGGFMGGAFLTHIPGIHYFADDLVLVKQSIGKILDLNCETFYVGHGGKLARKNIEKLYKKIK